MILSHSTELLDGNRGRELLTRAFATLSFGELGMDGFFVISGYLITKSFVTRHSIADYLARRVVRIYPAYIVNFLLCTFALAPCVGAQVHVWAPRFLADQAWAMLHLEGPNVAGAFAGLPKPALNGSVWSIGYEFRCYLLTVALGCLGAYSKRGRFVMLAAVAACLLLTAGSVLTDVHWHREAELGRPLYLVRLSGIYGVGALYYLFRDAVPITTRGALVAAPLLAACMFSRILAPPGWAIFGGYLIFWFAFRLRVLELSILDNKADISYGLYLYAWPVQNLTISLLRSIDPWRLCAITLAVSSLLGLASWIFIEKPAMRRVARSRPPDASRQPSP